VAPWHCPHCGALQPETARCWVCRRSSTTCSTCRNFRLSLASDVGYCALDRRRRPLTGLELRGCWEGRATNPAVASPDPGTAQQAVSIPLRGFVPVEEVATAPVAPGKGRGAPPVRPELPFIEVLEPSASLFGDPER
jgi:hypothetical protein